MHDAFEAVPVLEKLPLKIESIACYDDVLLVGTKESHLLQYKLKKGSIDNKIEVNLERSQKGFCKKPIQQLSVVQELYIIICLSDNVIAVHDLTSFGQILSLGKTKGASLFSCGVDRQVSLSGEVAVTLKLCVAVKKKILTYYWKNRNFLELWPEFNMYDVPKLMVWCRESICVGFRRDYFIVKVDTGETKELFPVGDKQQEPLVTKLDDDRLLLGRDAMSIVIDKNGTPTLKFPITWNDIPSAIEHKPPYLIGLLPKHVEIRTIETRSMIQTIDLQKAMYLCKGYGHIYIGSPTHLWKLVPIPLSYQIRQLLEIQEFELALQLAEMKGDNDEDKESMVNKIKNLHAFNLFCEHRFEESMELFSKLETDPAHVIGLYPSLLPNEYRKQIHYPKPPPHLEGGELEKGLLALQDYLTQKRKEVLKDIKEELKTMAIQEGNKTIKSKFFLTQIIDTTLLKCYIQTNDALVAPLLRLQDNNCHIEESEKILSKHKMFSELIILYERKGLHQKALNMLMNQAARPNSVLKGYEQTIQYLQHLGSDHLEIIFEYAKWVLEKHPEDGLKIFTEDLPEVENLPRDKVFRYLEDISKDLAISYLEHIINECEDETPEFHNAFAQLLREKVTALMTEYLQSLPEGHSPKKAGQEPGDVGVYREKLINFLSKSSFYVPERLLTRFPLDGFYEERAILLGRLGRHEQALGIYVHILKDSGLAEKYCHGNFQRGVDGFKDVYYYLLKMYLQPPAASSLGFSANQGVVPKVDVKMALKVLRENATKIDTSKALELIPLDTKMSDILVYLESVMEFQAKTKRDNQVLKSMFFAENLQVQEQRIFYEGKKVVINEEKVCKVCKKRLGNSAFARYPNGVIVHYYCCKDPKDWPPDN